MLKSVLNDVDGAGVEHPEVDHPAEVLWCPVEAPRFIHDLWRDALTTSAIFNLASMATWTGILFNAGTHDIKNAWWPYTSACRSFSWYACSFWIARLSVKIDVDSLADEAMDSSLAAFLLPRLRRFLRFLLLGLRATLAPVVGLAVVSMTIWLSSAVLLAVWSRVSCEPSTSFWVPAGAIMLEEVLVFPLTRV
jgi:hypothetical protein